MIELFSRAEDTFHGEELDPCVPLPLGDEISSLSAILLNEDYYAMLLQGKTILSEIAVLSHLYLIPFKAKAWLDLRERKIAGQHVDDKDIRKHKNDVLRLATLLTGREQCELPETVRQDMVLFVDSLQGEQIDLKSLHISGVTFADILAALTSVYLK